MSWSDFEARPIQDDAKICELPHGEMIRKLAKRYYYRHRSQMRTATFEPGPVDNPNSLSRYGVEDWRDLEAELWIIVEQKRLHDNSAPYVSTVLHSKIKTATEIGRRRYNKLREHVMDPVKNYGAEGEVLGDGYGDLWDSTTSEQTAFQGGYLLGEAPSTEMVKRNEKRRLKREEKKWKKSHGGTGNFDHYPVTRE